MLRRRRHELLIRPDGPMGDKPGSLRDACLKRLDKKNTALTDLLSTEQKRHEMKILNLKRNMSLLKSSLTLKDFEEQVVDETIADELEVEEDEANEGASDEAKADTTE
ncbi:unnamed protein product [Prunus brigantina]